jgi:tRNA threonylcarbamoyladenosine biosynthesis protein TsaB
LAASAFVVVNQGPGPFTTLRTVLATVNGLAYARGIPLVGVDGIVTLATAYQKERGGMVVGLLNAFNQDVYYAVAQQNAKNEIGFGHGSSFIRQLSVQFPDTTITFVGNGVRPLQAEIEGVFGSHAFLISPNVHTASIKQIAMQGLSQWQKQLNVVTQLMPIYLKQHSAELKL